MPKALNKASLAAAVRILARRDRDLARILKRDGIPPLWSRRPGFDTLVRIILEQQVSLASAAAVHRRLRDAMAPLTADRILEVGASGLRRLGLTRQKSSYCVNLARAIRDSDLKLSELRQLDDAAAMDELVCIKGIGPWTAQIYLLMALGRPDIWPGGDIALAAAMRSLKSLRERPSPAELVELAEAWRPYRSVAARMLWQYYLKGLAQEQGPSA